MSQEWEGSPMSDMPAPKAEMTEAEKIKRSAVGEALSVARYSARIAGVKGMQRALMIQAYREGYRAARAVYLGLLEEELKKRGDVE